ncbi:hypothetical protein CFOL_v3_28129 [Cephalotus follicularis]|uniref:Uncharacterized protein n=1 Tax=Cephalotus follicularis TaxID=3775 RepID=A0A1Q3CWT3_CEPFO|nr:hypothetical protein CFOL_v3_28129 [Cephalotus follicularis]
MTKTLSQITVQNCLPPAHPCPLYFPLAQCQYQMSRYFHFLLHPPSESAYLLSAILHFIFSSSMSSSWSSGRKPSETSFASTDSLHEGSNVCVETTVSAPESSDFGWERRV